MAAQLGLFGGGASSCSARGRFILHNNPVHPGLGPRCNRLWGPDMSIDISTSTAASWGQPPSAPQAPPAHVQGPRPAAVTPAVVGASGAAAKAAAPQRPAPAVPTKPDLQFDPQELTEQLEQAVAQLNEQMQKHGRDLRFSIDQAIDRTVVTVRSALSGEVVRQIPNESILNVARSIEELKGVLYNETI